MVPRVLLAASLLLVATSARAQARVTITAGVYEELKRFSGDPATNLLDGTALGGSIRVAAPLTAQWRLTLGEELGQTTIGLGAPFAPSKGAPLRQDRTQSRSSSTSVTLGFSPHVEGRFQIGYFVGANLLHVTRTIDTLVRGASVPNSAHTAVDNVVGLTLGAEAPVFLGRRLSVVPDIRVVAFRLSNPAPSGFTIQPGLGARWTF